MDFTANDAAARKLELWKAELNRKANELAQKEAAIQKQNQDLEESARLLNRRKARLEMADSQKQQEWEKREQELQSKEAEVAKEFAETRNKAIEAFNENFTACQARYYQRYRELETKFEETFQQFAKGREEQLLGLEKQYLDKNQVFQEAHARLVAEFQEQAQAQAAKAASQQAEALQKLQQDFQHQAQSYQQQFAQNLKELEDGHQVQLQDAQVHYADYYMSFQQTLQQKQEELSKRFAEATDNMEADYARRQQELQASLQERLEAVQRSLEEQSSRSLKEEAERRQQSWQEHQQHLQENFQQHEAEHQKLMEELRQRQSELTAKDMELEEQRRKNEEQAETLAMNERLLAAKRKEIENREMTLDDEVEDRLEARKEAWEAEKERLNKEIERLLARQETTESKVAMYRDLDSCLAGRSLAEVMETMRQERRELNEAYQNHQQATDERVAESDKRYQETLARLQEMQRHYQELTQQYQREKQQLLQSEQNAITADKLSIKLDSLEKQLQSEREEKNYYYERFKRISSEFDNGQEREARVAILEDPQIRPKEPQSRFALSDYEGAAQEINWLNHIEASCRDFGIVFPQRILYAFHTAMKTAEWSPLTVLSGVSGTGKSELPRLYAAFGGMNFLGVSVQPNWDSQESMLGFFNSIDNKFDAQPVLRFLVQSQKARTEECPYGLQDTMNLVLLDEMNLAYVELYFAEFLSKLESRRGRDDEDVPSLDVKLGAGQKPYELKLGRNVLWSGTMNQDETTKALSDKVLDRSFVINFPRPHHLVSRKKLPKLPEVRELLTYEIWQQWCRKEPVFTEEQIRPFREKVEKINGAMGEVGRAIGHRVWQSMEYYMSNYPMAGSEDPQKCRDAMNRAFEDQLVQKVMPKLRGIETRGRGKTCLETIQSILDSDEVTQGLVDDFQRGMELGYGQFIWNSAEYLQKVMPNLAEEVND
ncbi:hypothetical protein [Selenomonas ruminantium]|uniref:Chromosome partitioning protein ParA n=1 Tax=Selenomonas ruminantium TaxID=971 RepID=A0A1K1NLL6_SELRU|nr:hypothetical protein [Selenomonas ruminantium]SFW36187.1 hypothetical protein SAMN02910323_1475 [Selenomonas ruminantium]